MPNKKSGSVPTRPEGERFGGYNPNKPSSPIAKPDVKPPPSGSGVTPKPSGKQG
jgi:hypothetical protein